jgi:CheY-like chemotaxis protein
LRTEAPLARTPEKAPPTGSNGARRVLIADDNRDGAEIMAMLLEHSGFEVQLAHSGPDALAVAAQLRPDIAVLDIGMPGMSGYEVARAIRGQPWGVGITLIAVTGWGQEDDKRKAKDAGFDHHLTKPIDPNALEQLMAPAPPDLRG